MHSPHPYTAFPSYIFKRREKKWDEIKINSCFRVFSGEKRKEMERKCKNNGMEFYYPSPVYCTDNAAMIAAAAYYEYIRGVRHGWDLNAVPNLKIGMR